jgi:predicted dehydrogenase
MKIAIVGYGSIGKRHYDNFISLNAVVAVVSRRELKIENTFSTLESMVNSFSPDVIFICNETAEHINSLDELEDFKGYILIEKPLFSKVEVVKAKNVYVSYNLRFFEIISVVKKELKNEKILNASFYAGSYLPSWRPDRDYTKSYSAKIALGGGVLRDLSHELDLAQCLLGEIKSFYSLSEKVSHLKIDSDDQYSFLGKCEYSSQVNIHLNYTDRIGQRFFIINTDTKTIKADLYTNDLQINEKVLNFKNDRNASYMTLAKAVMSNEWSRFTSLAEGKKIMKVIEESSQNLSKEINL